MKFYHYTLRENFINGTDECISVQGIKASMEGGVHCCKTPEECLEFACINPLNIGKEICIIPFEWDENKVTETFDHNPEYIHARSFITDGDVPKDRIERNLNNIPLYSIG